jgi:hypothetical protein
VCHGYRGSSVPLVEIDANQRRAYRGGVDGGLGVADSRQRDSPVVTGNRQGDGIVASRPTTVNASDRIA